jgi:hypothetical protein
MIRTTLACCHLADLDGGPQQKGPNRRSLGREIMQAVAVSVEGLYLVLGPRFGPPVSG